MLSRGVAESNLMRISHIINPVKVSDKSDLFIAQPITFESMRVAKQFAESAIKDLRIDLVSVQYVEDREIVPDYFTLLTDLEKSVLDFSNFEQSRKLPIINDILSRAYSFSKDSDYLIYTNVDIALMPQFYLFIYGKILSGCDSLIINRRTISQTFSQPWQLYQMYSELGKPHPGFDCFVFKRDLYPKFILGKTCIGANWIGRVMFGNLVTFSQDLQIETDAHLTFHIGDDGAWLSGKFNDFDNFNKAEAYSILEQLKSATDDVNKLRELFQVKQFMDLRSKVRSNQNNLTLIDKVKQKIKKYIV